MFTDVANGINLYYGPDPNATVNETEGVVDEGRIRKAHPIWGVLMLTIPFIPMTLVPTLLAIALPDEVGWCTRLGFLFLAIVLCLPFSAIATPIYVLFVCGVGVFRVIVPKKLEIEFKFVHGILKTAEIATESAFQTCLGKAITSSFDPLILRPLHCLLPWHCYSPSHSNPAAGRHPHLSHITHQRGGRVPTHKTI